MTKLVYQEFGPCLGPGQVYLPTFWTKMMTSRDLVMSAYDRSAADCTRPCDKARSAVTSLGHVTPVVPGDVPRAVARRTVPHSAAAPHHRRKRKRPHTSLPMSSNVKNQNAQKFQYQSVTSKEVASEVLPVPAIDAGDKTGRSGWPRTLASLPFTLLSTVSPLADSVNRRPLRQAPRRHPTHLQQSSATWMSAPRRAALCSRKPRLWDGSTLPYIRGPLWGRRTTMKVVLDK
ncbi:hypothetical protein J6590_035206 [Homalodisca vitripennis]|nr:hypothetical protein J6590_035206 [Homalodisca vitripennis]